MDWRETEQANSRHSIFLIRQQTFILDFPMQTFFKDLRVLIPTMLVY